MLFYGLVGEKLSHSFSKQIHAMLGDYLYELVSVDKIEFDEFIKNRDFGGLNITIPYKQRIIPLCDTLSTNALRIGAVNTVVNKKGKLFGYNTDYLGFNYMLKEKGIELSGKKVLILGSGGTSLTATACAQDAGAREFVVVSRNGENNYKNISKHFDSEIIINTTPVGMFPDDSESPVKLSHFTECCGVVDVIYNPLKTALLLQAEELGINCSNGLLMLVAQAKYACELFFDTTIDDIKIMEIYKKLLSQLSNIVLIGMPSCGKSSIGKEIAASLNRPFIDTDILVEQNAGMTIPEIFEKYGELEFRQLEALAVKSAGAKTGVVIASGGGAILRKDACNSLRKNGKMVFIKRDIDLLSTQGRPLSKNTEAIKALYNQRLPIYEKCSDISILNNDTVKSCAAEVLKKIEETVL